MNVMLVVVFALMVIYCRSTVIHSSFYLTSICDVEQRISSGCTTQVGHPMTMIGCALRCGRHGTCIGASLDEGGSCFVHHECQYVSACGVVATDHRYLSKTCANGGELEPSNQRCQCVDGWVGSTCQEYPTRCYDLHHANNLETFVTTKLDVYGDGSHLVPVMCRRHATWYETLILRNEGQQDFNKTWAEYRDGFVIDDTHYWVGLKHMHTINSVGQLETMTLTIYFKEGKITFRRLTNVVVSDNASGYSLVYGSVSGPVYNTKGYAVDNCWSGLTNTPFSGWDNDVDGASTSNCAASAGSGWWFKDCSPPCNLFGWADQYSTSKPASSIINLAGIDMMAEQGNVRLIHLSLH